MGHRRFRLLKGGLGRAPLEQHTLWPLLVLSTSDDVRVLGPGDDPNPERFDWKCPVCSAEKKNRATPPQCFKCRRPMLKHA